MALSKPEIPTSSFDDVDRLSELPELVLLHIFSFLPTKFAIRTSAVSRRFRHLWTASPSMDLDLKDYPECRAFTDATNRCFRLRNPSYPLVRFSLKSHYWRKKLPIKSVINWLNRANSLGLRDLSLRIHTSMFDSFFPLILSFQSLQSLVLTSWDVDCRYFFPASLKSILPPTFLATRLKRLHLKTKLCSSDLRRFIMEQTQLEYLCLGATEFNPVDIFSPTVKKAVLIFNRAEPKISLSFPVLEVLDMLIALHPCLKEFHGEMPLLRKANLRIPFVSEVSVPLLGEILRCFCNVSELSIQVGDAFPDDTEPSRRMGHRNRQKQVKHQFHLIEQGLPTFCHLRSLKLSMCFHENGISDLICFLQSTPVLESLQLDHVEFNGGWESKLPQDSEGNDQHAHFSNLHLGDMKIELVRCLCSDGHHKKFKRRRISYLDCTSKAKVYAVLAENMEKVTTQFNSKMQTMLARFNLPPLLIDNPPRQFDLPTQEFNGVWESKSPQVYFTQAEVDAILEEIDVILPKHIEELKARLTSQMQNYWVQLSLPPLPTDNCPRQSHLLTQVSSNMLSSQPLQDLQVNSNLLSTEDSSSRVSSAGSCDNLTLNLLCESSKLFKCLYRIFSTDSQYSPT